jgi:hypothetical protein
MGGWRVVGGIGTMCVALKRTCVYKRSGIDDWPTEKESMPRGVRRLSNRLGQYENFCS